jgi:group I intron endonuclease
VKSKIVGVYQIKNLINGKMYIGSSINVLNRWSRHKTELINEKHHSIKLQRSVNKYGIINFTYYNRML